MQERNGASIRNIAEVMWQTPPEHYDHVLEGEGLMELDGTRSVVRPHDCIFIPPGVEHAIYNTGLRDLVFIVVTTPPTDD